MAERKHMPLPELERWLMPNLNYEAERCSCRAYALG